MQRPLEPSLLSSKPLAIITVCLNDREGLARTISSIQSQTLLPDIHIVADGGSTDGSLELALKAEKTFSNMMVLEGPDRGIYNGMNRALKQIPDGWRAWYLNSGDFLIDPDSIERTVQTLPHDVHWAGGPMLSIRPSGRLYRVAEPRGTAAIPPQPTVVMNVELLRAFGPFREDLKYASDGIFLTEVADFHAPFLYETPCVAFPLGGRSSRNLSTTLRELASSRVVQRKGVFNRLGQSLSRTSVIGKTRIREVVFNWEKSTRATLPRLLLDRAVPAEQAVHMPHWPHTRFDELDFSCCMGPQLSGQLFKER